VRNHADTTGTQQPSHDRIGQARTVRQPGGRDDRDDRDDPVGRRFCSTARTGRHTR
jgi:hypothetical protein